MSYEDDTNEENVARIRKLEARLEVPCVHSIVQWDCLGCVTGHAKRLETIIAREKQANESLAFRLEDAVAKADRRVRDLEELVLFWQRHTAEVGSNLLESLEAERQDHEHAVERGSLAVQFACDLYVQAHANVNDCRLDYATLQVDKDELDKLGKALGLNPIDWHPVPCKHEGTRWAKP